MFHNAQPSAPGAVMPFQHGTANRNHCGLVDACLWDDSWAGASLTDGLRERKERKQR